MKKLPPYKPLTYPLLEGADFLDLPTLEKIYADLDARLGEVKTEADMRAWIELSDEFEDASGEAWQAVTLDRDSDTNNPEYKAAYDRLVNEVSPPIQDIDAALQKKLQAHPAFQALPPYFDELRKGINTAVTLYREENTELGTQDTNLASAYEEATSNLTVELDGKTLTSQQIKPVLEGTDRAKRQEAWVKEKEARLAHRQEFNEIFAQQVDLRCQMAKNAGYALPGRPETGDYLHYGYAARGRNSTPEETLQLHQAIEDHIVPFFRAFQRDVQEKMAASGQLQKGEKLRPWDLTVDPDGLPPLKPFASQEEFVPGMIQLANAVDPRLAPSLEEAARDGLLDAEDRPGKTPCYGFCATLPLSRRQFLCVNNALTQEGIATAAHEGLGHGSHAYFCKDQDLSSYRGEPGMELCELASMTQELVVPNKLGVVYQDPSEKLRAQRFMIADFFNYVLKVASTDAFQHWVYAHPESTQEEKDAQWLKEAERFGGIEDWSGYEEFRRGQWQERAHLINAPLYSEYLQSGIGALQISARYDKDPEGAIADYITFLKAGGSVDAHKGYALAGIRFDGTGETLPETMAAIEKRMDALRAEEAALQPRREIGGIEQSRRTVPVAGISPAPEKTQA
ncbi:MAG: M3 family metallopeptidase [Verrucomicrobium sp.]|nr:M3 family metallopeptidase [Verrucomicrobium sp.]